MTIPIKPAPPTTKNNCPAEVRLNAKAIALSAFINGTNNIHLFLKLTARSKNINEAKKLFTINEPCCAAILLTGRLHPILIHPAQIAAINEKIINGKINTALFMNHLFKKALPFSILAASSCTVIEQNSL